MGLRRRPRRGGCGGAGPRLGGATPTTATTTAAGWYAHGADWAQAVDFTVVVTLRCDVQPLQLVAATRTHRRPWPVMIWKCSTPTAQA